MKDELKNFLDEVDQNGDHNSKRGNDLAFHQKKISS